MNFDVKLVQRTHEDEGPLELIEKADRQLGELLVTLHKLADMKILLQETEARQLK